MNQLSKNLIFIGNILFSKNNSSTTYNFKLSEYAKNLDVSSQTLSHWLKTGIISQTQLRRITIKINDLIDIIELTPNQLLENDIETEYNAKLYRVKEPESLYNAKQDKEILKIQHYLKKYPYLKPTILELLKKHDKK